MHGLEFKHDWDAAKQKWRAWWNHEHTYESFMSIHTPRKNPLPHAPVEETKPTDYEFQWTDYDTILKRAEKGIATTAFIGQCFPHVTASLGPGAFGCYVGARPVFHPTTVWYEPCFKDIRSANVKFDRKNRWWKWTVETTRKMIAASKDQTRYLVAMPDLIENADTLAALLGNEELLYYLADCPEEVARLQDQLLPLWFKAFDGLYELMRDPDGGMAFMAFNIWAPGKLAKTQCDFSAMISPGMYKEFVLPWLTAQCDWLDYSIYHLDGTNAVCHLDALLTIPSLDCIQWTPGAGQPEGGDPCWDPIYRKALDAGKLLHVHANAGSVLPFLKRFGKNDVYLLTWVKSEEEAWELTWRVEAIRR